MPWQSDSNILLQTAQQAIFRVGGLLDGVLIISLFEKYKLLISKLIYTLTKIDYNNETPLYKTDNGM